MPISSDTLIHWKYEGLMKLPFYNNVFIDLAKFFNYLCIFNSE